MMLILAVAAGGAAGALGRYFIAGWLERSLTAGFGVGFPYGTFAVNCLGSFALGLFVEAIALGFSVSPEVRALIVVGLLGSFTTFSAFSLDTMLLFERGESLRAVLYVTASVALSVGGLFVGLRLMRVVLS